MTKTITDTSGAVEPNAQQVFFGTFNGISDDVTTPTSGTLTVEGDYKGVGCGSYTSSNKGVTSICGSIKGIKNWGNIEIIPDNAFRPPALETTGIDCTTFPESLKSIGSYAFQGQICKKIHIPSSINHIGTNPWSGSIGTAYMESLTVDTGNTAYTIDQNCLVELSSKRLICHRYYISEPLNIPDYITHIDQYALSRIKNTEITIPASIQSVESYAFAYAESLTTVRILATTPPTGASYMFDNCDLLTSIIVPVGSGDAYKNKAGWRNHKDIIVEAS